MPVLEDDGLDDTPFTEHAVMGMTRARCPKVGAHGPRPVLMPRSSFQPDGRCDLLPDAP